VEQHAIEIEQSAAASFANRLRKAVRIAQV
jgi:hypothetical protein